MKNRVDFLCNDICKMQADLIIQTTLSEQQTRVAQKYQSGIKIKINDYEYLMPENATIGNRYLISKDKKLQLCFPLYEIESYAKEILEKNS